MCWTSWDYQPEQLNWSLKNKQRSKTESRSHEKKTRLPPLWPFYWKKLLALRPDTDVGKKSSSSSHSEDKVTLLCGICSFSTRLLVSQTLPFCWCQPHFFAVTCAALQLLKVCYSLLKNMTAQGSLFISYNRMTPNSAAKLLNLSTYNLI